MKPLVKFILYLSLIITIITTHVYVATEFYNRGGEKGYSTGVADAAMYMHGICYRGSNIYFVNDPTAYFCNKAVAL